MRGVDSLRKMPNGCIQAHTPKGSPRPTAVFDDVELPAVERSFKVAVFNSCSIAPVRSCGVRSCPLMAIIRVRADRKGCSGR